MSRIVQGLSLAAGFAAWWVAARPADVGLSAGLLALAVVAAGVASWVDRVRGWAQLVAWSATAALVILGGDAWSQSVPRAALAAAGLGLLGLGLVHVAGDAPKRRLVAAGANWAIAAAAAAALVAVPAVLNRDRSVAVWDSISPGGAALRIAGAAMLLAAAVAVLVLVRKAAGATAARNGGAAKAIPRRHGKSRARLAPSAAK